jgi:hypothetical protein
MLAHISVAIMLIFLAAFSWSGPSTGEIVSDTESDISEAGEARVEADA